jgi:hypothetical protein
LIFISRSLVFLATDEALNTSPQGLKLVVRVDAEFTLAE